MESLPPQYGVDESAVRDRRPCMPQDDERSDALQLPDMRLAQLARTIELEIIPRLMLAHRAIPQQVLEPKVAGGTIDPTDVSHFAKLVLCPDEDIALTWLASVRARGVAIEQIYVDLLAPTARYLGELWEQDLCDFSDVTIGLGRLQRVLRELSPSFGHGVDHPTQGRRVLLLPSPGEQHTFGLVMVGEFFRRAGWDVAGGAWSDGNEAPAIVRDEWFDVVGFSLAADVHLYALRDCIQAVRHRACNRQLAIIVGGPVFGAHPEYVGQIGADGMTADGRQAPTLAEQLIEQCAGR